MSSLSSLFLIIALIFAVVIGPQTRPWAWGPAMLALGVSVAAALPEFWKKSQRAGDLGVLIFGSIVVSWFAWRAWFSPVAQLGEADLMLLAGTVGAFISIRAIQGNALAERILLWGIALLLLANVLVIGKQVLDPFYSPIFKSLAGPFPAGFYAHYNEAANYLIASSLIIAAGALLGKYHSVTRIFWGLIAIAGLVAVYFTRSRGGILGASIGCGVLVGGALIVGKRRNAKWFGPILIGAPLVILAIGTFLFSGWQASQKIRNAGDGVVQLLDNNYRLYFMGIAVSTIDLHPWTGGGSRSYSWESYQFLETTAQGTATTRKPEQVHNELLQAATDYGIIGAVLVAGFLGIISVTALIRMLFSKVAQDLDSVDSWRLGGLAALAGMLTQSCFSFVFHLLPGVILLGICLGKLTRSQSEQIKTYQIIGSKILLSLSAAASIGLLVSTGWKGTKVTHALWASHLSKFEISTNESRADALTQAISIWPHFTFYQERASISQAMAASSNGEKSEKFIVAAIDDYGQAQRLHAYDPGIAINLANLLSQMKRDSEAEKFYEQAALLQGGMELAFNAHYFFANHLLDKATRGFDVNDPSRSLESLEAAYLQIDEAVQKVQSHSSKVNALRPIIYESLGVAREANGKYMKALEAYNLLTTPQNGSRAHYRAGSLLSKMASASWAARRPSEALRYFKDAKERILLARELPQDISANQRADHLAYIDKAITYLQGAKVE